MRKFIISKNKAVFVFAASALFFSPACVNSSNSNVATVWSRDGSTPSPAPPVEAAQPTPSVAPVNTPTPVTSPSFEPTPPAGATAASSPVDDPFVKDSNTVVNNNVKESTESSASSTTLMIPVLGIKREELHDTFNDARSEGRVHDAIDIMAAGGTPIIAAADGKIIKFFDSVKGGITVYQLSPDEHTVYYYAHLQRRADDLRENAFVKQGTLIGYVGDTGNAGPGNNHLHFAIWTISDPKRFYDGTNINPYPLLKQGIIKSQ